MRLGSDLKASFLKIRLLRKKVLRWISDRNRNGNILEPLESGLTVLNFATQFFFSILKKDRALPFDKSNTF